MRRQREGEILKNEKRDKIASILAEKPLSIQDSKFCFMEDAIIPENTAGTGVFGFLQDTLKKYPTIYRFLVTQLSPVLTSREYRKLLNTLLANYGSDKVIVNYGSGPRILNNRRDLINVDICSFDAVDVLSDTRLPFKEDSVDLILSLAVLEHISQPSLAVSEMLRCLRPNGELFVFVPFMQPFHAAPYDYQRWTEVGLREVFRDFDILQSGIGAGPTSGFLWVLQHWIALLLSFGSSTIKDLLLIALMIVTFPLKYLDIPLEHFVRSKDIASGFYVHAKKPDTK